MNTVLQKDRVLHVIDSLKDRIATEIPAHSQRWKNECDPQGDCGIQSYEAWLEDVHGLVTFTDNVYDKVRDDLAGFYGLSGSSTLTVVIENPEMGQIYINGEEYHEDDGPWTFFKDVPLEVYAEPNPGYVFLEWAGYGLDPAINLSLQDDGSLIARFGNLCELPAVIDGDVTIGVECDAYFTQGHVQVLESGKLTISPGTHLFITPGDSIKLQGELIAQGTQEHPVILRSAAEDTHWGSIFAHDALVTLNYTEFYNCKSALNIEGGEIDMRNSTVHFSPYFFSDIVSVHYANTTLINNQFTGPDDQGKSDVIDCDEVGFALIEGNFIDGTTDDGIDIGTGSQNVTVKGNVIRNCNSMGISVGEESNAKVGWNIVSGCGTAGIQVHFEAVAEIDHNTLYDNETAIRAFHDDDQPMSGGHAIITNTILSGSLSSVVETVENSVVSFEYCISDTDPLTGQGNLFGDPMMEDPGNGVFDLMENSPCIDSGQPGFPLDPDGSVTDMGALYFDHNNAIIDKNREKQVLVFPNPATDQLTCILTDTAGSIKELRIINQQGQEVLFEENTGQSSIRLNISNCTQGLYHLIILNDQNKKIHSKFIVVRPFNQ